MAAAEPGKQSKLSVKTLVFSGEDETILRFMMEPHEPYNKEFIRKLIVKSRNQENTRVSNALLREVHRALKAIAGVSLNNTRDAVAKLVEILGSSDFTLQDNFLDGDQINKDELRTFAKLYDKVVRNTKLLTYQKYSNAAYARVHDMMATIVRRLSKFFVTVIDQNGNSTPIYAIRFTKEQKATQTEKNGAIAYSYEVVSNISPVTITRKQLAALYRSLDLASSCRTKAANASNKSAVLRGVNATRTNTIQIPQALGGLLQQFGLSDTYRVGDFVQETVLNTALKTAMRKAAKERGVPGGFLVVDPKSALDDLLKSVPDKEFVITPRGVGEDAFYTHNVYAAPKVKEGNDQVIYYKDSNYAKRRLVLSAEVGQSPVSVNLTNICKYSRVPNALKKLKYAGLTPMVITDLTERIHTQAFDILGHGTLPDDSNFRLLYEAIRVKLVSKSSTASFTMLQVASEVQKLARKSLALFTGADGHKFFVPDAISGLLSLYTLMVERINETSDSLKRREEAFQAVVNSSIM